MSPSFQLSPTSQINTPLVLKSTELETSLLDIKDQKMDDLRKSFSSLTDTDELKISQKPLSDCDLIIIAHIADENCSEKIFLVLNRLRAVGLHFRILPWVKKNKSIAIFVFCPSKTLARERYIQGVRDWLSETLATCSDPPVQPTTMEDIEILTNDTSSAERLRLIYNLIVMPTYAGGAGITKLDKLVEQTDAVGGSIIESIFAPHDLQSDKNWLRRWNQKWLVTEADIDDLQHSCGEKVAFYFAFLRFYSLFLAPLSVIGVLSYFFLGNFSRFYTYATIIWSIVFLVAWDYKVKLYSAKWGTISSKGNIHPNFVPERIISDEQTNEKIPIYPRWKRWLSLFLITLPILLFMAFISLLLTFVVCVSELVFQRLYQGPFHEYLYYFPTILYAALIPQLNMFYSMLTKKLNRLENYSTQSAYDNSFNVKLFIFSSIIVYLGLYAEAWLFTPLSDIIESVFSSTGFKLAEHFSGPEALQQRISSIVVTGQITDAISEVIIPYIMGRYTEYTMRRKMDSKHNHNNSIKEALGAAEDLVGDGFKSIIHAAKTTVRKRKKVNGHSKLTATEIEKTFGLPKEVANAVLNEEDILNESLSMDDLSGELVSKDDKLFIERMRVENSMDDYQIFEDYAEMALQFGYVVLFSSAWSLAPLACLINNFFEQRTDAFKICKTSRRPIPARSYGIGAWRQILITTSWMGSITGTSLVNLYRNWNNHEISSKQTFERFPKIVVAVIIAEHIFFAVWQLVQMLFWSFTNQLAVIDKSTLARHGTQDRAITKDDNAEEETKELPLYPEVFIPPSKHIYPKNGSISKMSPQRSHANIMSDSFLGEGFTLMSLQREIQRTEFEHRAVFFKSVGLDPAKGWLDNPVNNDDEDLVAAQSKLSGLFQK